MLKKNRYILSILYNINLAPDLDFLILDIVTQYIPKYDIDCCRDERYRYLYIYIDSKTILKNIKDLIVIEGSKTIENTNSCLLDFISILDAKSSQDEIEKIKLRNRISEIYRNQTSI